MSRAVTLQMQPQPWPVRDRGWNGGPGGAETTQLRSAWLFNDPCTGQWTIALDYKSQPSSPIYQVHKRGLLLLGGSMYFDVKITQTRFVFVLWTSGCAMYRVGGVQRKREAPGAACLAKRQTVVASPWVVSKRGCRAPR